MPLEHKQAWGINYLVPQKVFHTFTTEYVFLMSTLNVTQHYVIPLGPVIGY